MNPTLCNHPWASIELTSSYMEPDELRCGACGLVLESPQDESVEAPKHGCPIRTAMESEYTHHPRIGSLECMVQRVRELETALAKVKAILD